MSTTTPLLITMPKIAEKLSRHLYNHTFSITEAESSSVIDLLYSVYADTLGQDPPEIHQGFLTLDKHLDPLGLEVNNAIFSIVCELCGAYEKRAFKDALQLGSYLILELLETENATCKNGSSSDE